MADLERTEHTKPSQLSGQSPENSDKMKAAFENAADKFAASQLGHAMSGRVAKRTAPQPTRSPSTPAMIMAWS
jgi:hypothetical protein